MGNSLVGALLALVSAAIWGAGDFSGGYAARRATQYQVLSLSALSGLITLLVLMLLQREPLPNLESALWAAGAGLSGALGTASLYYGLSRGQAALVAPTAGVVGAALPAIFNILVSGMPRSSQQAGFALAGLGIWLVSHPARNAQSFKRGDLVLAMLSGAGFGGFFILISRVEAGTLYAPLLVARILTLLVGLSFLLLRRERFPAPRHHPVAMLAGILDASANIFFLLAVNLARLDIVSVLASLYPAGTVLLARALLKEAINRTQWLGVGICLVAIGLIVG